MGYFTARERNVLSKSINERAQTRQREVARDDFAPRRRLTNTDIGSLVQQVREGSIGRIDALITELQHRRETILAESARMHREIIAYAKFNQSTMDASRVVSESLANLARLPDAPVMNDLADAVSDQRDRSSVSEHSAGSDGEFELAGASRLPGTQAGVTMTECDAPNE